MQERSKILVVDDVEENLVAMEALLRRDDMEIVVARSGAQALELLLAEEFSLALIDVQMPEIDGFELAELMRGSQRSKYIPIIFVTAGAHDARRVFQGYETGAVDFLFKPIEANILRQKVHTFVELDAQKRQLAEQYRRLQASEAQLKDAVQARDDVLAIVSHDIRNFLYTIKMSTYVLSTGGERVAGDAREVLHQRIMTAVELMSRVITDFLDMANIRAGRFSVARRPEVANRIVADAVAALEPLAHEKGITLAATIPDEDTWVMCDRDRVLQALANVVGNSIKFGGSGASVQIVARTGDDGYEIAISDTGPGIAAADLGHVFDAYWSGRDGPEKGTGLGLYITRRIIEAHGRSIGVESEQGRGTTVRFSLPLATDPDAQGRAV